jgi:hypothetical protein
MASYEDKWYIIELDEDTQEEIGLRKEDGQIKYYTSEAGAIAALQYYYGNLNSKLVREQTVTHTVST